MRKLIFTMILIILIITGIVLVTEKIQTQKHKKIVHAKIEEIEKFPVKLKNINGIEYKLYQIPEYTVNFLKTKSEFKPVYKHKKFVVYIKDDSANFSKEYNETFEKIVNDKNYTKQYNFVSRKAKITVVTMPKKNMRLAKKNNQKLPEDILTPAEGNAKVDFLSKCASFCIVNPSKNQIFTIKGNSKNEAENIEYILNEFKKW